MIALAQDPPSEKHLSSKKEVDSENLIDKLMIRRSFLMSVVMFVSTIPIFYIFSKLFSIAYARTMVLVILSITQWFNALNVRSRYKSIFTLPLTVWFIGVFASVIVLQYVAVETPLGNKLLHTENLAFSHWLLAILVSTSIIWVEEVRKLLARTTNN